MRKAPGTGDASGIRTLLAGLGLALVVAVIGAWPHVRFSLELGQPAWFKYSYDEEAYARQALAGAVRPDRLAGALAIRGLAAVAHKTGGNLPLALAGADAVLPFAVALAAFFAAGGATRRLGWRLLLAVLLLFGESFLSPASRHVWPPALFDAQQRLAAASTLFPAHATTFFALYRTPDPQVSWIWTLLALGCLVRLACRPKARGPWLGLVGLNFLTPFVYVFCAVAVLATQVLWIGLLVRGRPGRGLAGRVGLALAGAGLGYALSRLCVPAAASTTGQALFASRLPVVTVNVALSAGLSLMAACRLWRARPAVPDPADLLGLALAALPMLLLNQQLVTGRMVMATQFEPAVNAMVLVLGLGLLLRRRPDAPDRPGASALVPAACLAICLAIVAWGQARSYALWLPVNEQAQAAAKAVDAARDRLPDGDFRVDGLDPGLLDTVAFLRPGTRMVCPFSLLFDAPLAGLDSPEFQEPEDTPFRDRLFEHWLRNGWTPQMVSDVLTTEADAALGGNIQFFFSFLDSWKPLSLGRASRPRDMLARVPRIAADYAAFAGACRGADKTVALLSASPLAGSPSPCLNLSPLAETRVGAATVFAYWQTPR